MTRRSIVLLALGVLVLAVGFAVTPYALPTSVALGPCGRDWTSPSSYLPRSSPTRSVTWTLGETSAKLCYGSPSARGRAIFGGLIPWWELWRTGANEPTRLFIDGPVEVAGISLGAGRYSLYTRPAPDYWEVWISESTFHWGNAISSAVRAREVGTAMLRVGATDGAVESLGFSWQAKGSERGVLRLEWESTRIDIPIAVAEASRTASD